MLCYSLFRCAYEISSEDSYNCTIRRLEEPCVMKFSRLTHFQEFYNSAQILRCSVLQLGPILVCRIEHAEVTDTFT